MTRLKQAWLALMGRLEPEVRVDPECVCRGNWRAIVKESEPYLGKKFTDRKRAEWTFFGVIHSDDDYYYGMWRKNGELALLTCCGSLEAHGYKPKIAKGACRGK